MNNVRGGSSLEIDSACRLRIFSPTCQASVKHDREILLAAIVVLAAVILWLVAVVWAIWKCAVPAIPGGAFCFAFDLFFEAWVFPEWTGERRAQAGRAIDGLGACVVGNSLVVVFYGVIQQGFSRNSHRLRRLMVK